MTDAEQIKPIIDDLEPEDGWWKDDTADNLWLEGTRLLKWGLSLEDVEYFLRSMHRILKREYGVE